MKKRKLFLIIGGCLLAAALIAVGCLSLIDKPLDKSMNDPASDPNTHRVTFFSDDGTTLKIDYVSDGASAVPPVEPQMSFGKVFTSWDQDFSVVTSDMDIHPVCEEVTGKENVFALSGAYISKDQPAIVSLTLSGDVCLAGFDLELSYDANTLKLESLFDEDGALVYNVDTPGVVRMNYVSVGNTLGEVDLCKLKFSLIDGTAQTPITMEVKSVYSVNEDDSMDIPKYNTVDSAIFITGG